MKTGILLSGGMDSVALAFWKRPQIAFTVNYGQLGAEGELRASRIISQELNIQHEIISVDCRQLGSGDLTGIPQLQNTPTSDWWAFRNQLLLTLAGMKCLALGVRTLMFGSVKTDSFIDSSPDFFDKIGALFAIQEGNIEIIAPAINLTTTELIKTSGIPNSVLAWSHSCNISDYACGHCRGCIKYLAVMNELKR